MKRIIALGLLMLSLLLAVTLPRTGINSPPSSGGEPTSPEAQPISQARNVRRVTSRTITAKQQLQIAHDTLVAEVEGEEDPDLRSEALEHAVQSISDADLPATLDLLVGGTSPAMAEFRELLVRRWAESDSPAAAAWTAQLAEGSIHRDALKQVTVAWAHNDLPGAVNWLRALPEGESKQAATLGLAYEAARTEPMTALELASRLPPTRERDDLLVHAVSQWAETDSAAAGAWAATVPAPSIRQDLFIAVAIASAEKDGAAAATLAANALVPGDGQDRAAVSIVQRWAQNSPEAAASWVSKFADTPSRDAAAQNLVALWVTQDSEAAVSWLRELPAGSLREVGFSAYARALADRDRGLAADGIIDKDLGFNRLEESN